MNKPAVEMVATDKLIPYARNAKKHDEAQVSLIAGSIRQFGFNNPILIAEDNGIVAGHGRVLAAMKLGMAEVPCIRLSHLDENQRRAYILADNRLAELGGGWDLDMLAAEMDALGEVEIDVGELGFDESFLSLMELPETDNAVDAEAQIDKAEELRVKWGVETGQLWQLGEHRLICGDCTDRAVVERVMQNERAAITFTSPPYNAGVSAKLSGNTSIDDNLYKNEYNDNKPQIEYLELLQNFTSQSLLASEYVFVNIQFLSGNKRAFVDYLNVFRDQLADIAIWDKVHAAPAAAQRVMDSRFEFVLIFSEKANRAIGTREFRGMVHNVYTGNPQRHNDYAGSHAATFPVDFPEHFINTFTNDNELIFEPFCGTGTTLIACERLGRKCRAVEISPAYCAVAIQRWVDVTGKEPVLI
jgi:DNA modification methylase